MIPSCLFCFSLLQPMITTLETLNIGQNNLGIDGIMKLKEGLMKNKFLQRMGMFSCRINDEGNLIQEKKRAIL